MANQLTVLALSNFNNAVDFSTNHYLGTAKSANVPSSFSPIHKLSIALTRHWQDRQVFQLTS